MTKNYKIYFPKGIISCKNYKEKICLHLLEHLIVNTLSKKFSLKISENIKASINFDYIWFHLNIQEKFISDVDNFFKNIKKNISKSAFSIEKKRVFEELLWHKYNLIDPTRKIEEIIFSKIYKFHFIEPPFNYASKILKRVNFEDVIYFIDKFFDYSEMLFLEFSDSKFRIIKKPKKFVEFERNLFFDQRINFYKLKNRKLFQGCIFVFLLENNPTTILFSRYLDKYIDSVIKENIIFKGLAYSYFYKPFYLFLDKIIVLILIPTSKPQVVFNTFNKALNPRKFLFSESVINFKKDILKLIKTKFFKFFEPYIVFLIFKNQKLYPLRQTFEKIRNLDFKDFKNIFEKELRMYKFLIK